MFELYATWATLPILMARIGRRPASWRAMCWLAVSLVAILCALQDATTNKDREVYAFLIDAIKDDDTFSMEPGFYLIVKLLGVALSGPELNAAFFFVVAALSMAIKLRLFKRYGGSIFGCLAAFFSYFFLLHEVTQVRTGLAIAFLYLSWFAFAEGRKRDFWLYGIAAMMFHYSCVLFVIAPFLFFPDGRRKFTVTVAIAALLAAASALQGSAVLGGLELLAGAVGVDRLGVYFQLLQEGVLADITPLRLVPHTLLLIAAACTQRRWRRDRLTFFLVQIYVYGLLLFIILSPIPALAYRVSDLFLFAGVFLLGRMRSYSPRNVYYPLVVAYTAVFVVYTIQFSGLFVLPSAN